MAPVTKESVMAAVISGSTKGFCACAELLLLLLLLITAEEVEGEVAEGVKEEVEVEGKADEAVEGDDWAFNNCCCCWRSRALAA